MLGIAFVLAAYGIIADQYWSHPPQPTRNFAAEFNERILRIPDHERAWIQYRPVLIELRSKWPEEWLEVPADDLEDAAFISFLCSVQPLRQPRPQIIPARHGHPLHPPELSGTLKHSLESIS